MFRPASQLTKIIVYSLKQQVDKHLALVYSGRDHEESFPSLFFIRSLIFFVACCNHRACLFHYIALALELEQLERRGEYPFLAGLEIDIEFIP